MRSKMQNLNETDPDQTIPAGLGETRSGLAPSPLDSSLYAAAYLHQNLELCRAACDAGLSRLAYAYARAAAHWQGVLEDRRAGAVLAAASESL